LIEGGVLASGGVSFFLAGAERTVETTPLFGVHSWQHCWQSGEQAATCRDASDYPAGDELHLLHKSYISEMLGSDAFYWHSIRAAPSSSIHWLSDADLEAFGLSRSSHEAVAVPNNLQDAFLKELEAVCGECARDGA